MEIALEGLQHRTYILMDHTIKVLRVSRTTLCRRVKAGKKRKEAREPTQVGFPPF